MHAVIDRWLRVDEENEVRRTFVVGVANIAVLAQFFLNIFQWLTLYPSIGVVEPVYVDESESDLAVLYGFLVGQGWHGGGQN